LDSGKISEPGRLRQASNNPKKRPEKGKRWTTAEAENMFSFLSRENAAASVTNPRKGII
jgi:hypothetical protein